MRQKKKWSVVVVVLLGILFLFALTDLAKFFDKTYVIALVTSFGAYAPLIYITLYAAGTLLLVPGTPLSLLGGFLFGSAHGTLYAMIGSTLGAYFAYVLARYVARDWVEGKLSKRFPRLRDYDRKLEEHGFLTVFFLRVVPLFPFTLLNYAIGLTRVKNRDFIIGTVLGLAPATYLLVSIGAESQSPLGFRLYLFIAFFALMTGIPYFIKTYTKMQTHLKEKRSRKKESGNGEKSTNDIKTMQRGNI